MEIKKAYDNWSEQYDSNKNRTRDMEATAFKKCLESFTFHHVLELGCGTGKNTEWLLKKSKQITAVDFSEQMLTKAREKIIDQKVVFINADLLQPWDFATVKFDLISFSLVLEHIENLDAIFKKAAAVIQNNGLMYIGELHPLKQYGGSKARFETENGTVVLTCYTHHVSAFLKAAKKYGFELIQIEEFFDDGDEKGIPRILALLLKYDICP